MSTAQRIEALLADSLAPVHLEVIDESHKHNVPPGAESHFRVRIVSTRFEGRRLVERHRDVNRLLRAQLDAGVHALALEALTPTEWRERGGEGRDSPPCLGGSSA